MASFAVSLIWGIEKVWIRKRGGRIKVFCQKFFFHEAEKILPEDICALVQKFFGSEKFIDKKRGYQGFPSKGFCLTVPKFARVTFCALFQKIFGSEKVYG